MNLASLNVEFDIPVVPFNEPQGQAKLVVWGVGILSIGQATNLQGQNVMLKAGMSKGLPLAKPEQAGTIVVGTIWQAWGQWQGANQTLEMIFYPGAALPDTPIDFACTNGSSLGPAIQAALAKAFAGYKIVMSIKSLVLTGGDQKGHYDRLSNFADFINQRAQLIGQKAYGQTYPGVFVSIAGTTIYIYDEQLPQTTTKTIAFEDLVGQPTWIDAATVNFKTVLRADLQVGMTVQLPQGIRSPYALTSDAAAAPNSSARSQTSFQGRLLIREVHHFANFRQADADSWCIAFSAVPAP